MSSKTILILGITGMLGYTLFRQLSQNTALDVHGTARTINGLEQGFPDPLTKKLSLGIDVTDLGSVTNLLSKLHPDIVINCIGIIKQLPIAKDPLPTISINALFPHQLAKACKDIGATMIHISTDCVFSGKKGNYCEEDNSDAEDLYGRSKFLGEVYYEHCVTLRTSIIGHELKSHHGLIEWFLAQEGKAPGYTHAIYTGFPTIELASIIEHQVIPNKELKGLYHVASAPISKYELLRLVAARYEKKIEIIQTRTVVCDRSLNAARFQKATGYQAPSWDMLVEKMYQNYNAFFKL